MVGLKMFSGGTPGLDRIMAWFPVRIWRLLIEHLTKFTSIPETMKSGKRTEKTHPAMTWLSGMLVITARGRPKPRKYGQLISTRFSLLWSSIPKIKVYIILFYSIKSQPWENHLYSKLYRAWRRHWWTRLTAAAIILIGSRAKTLPWRRKMISTTIENTVSAIITDIERFTSGRPCEDLESNINR